jgi:preprotein translocase subunit YajC
MPNLLFTTILAAATTTTTTGSKKSGSSSEIFLVILVLAVGGYFFFLRPRQQRARAQRGGTGKALAVGDEVVTIGGILGVVSAVDGDAITVEVAPDTHMSFLRRAVNPRAAIPGAPVSNPIAEDGADEAAYDDGYEDEDESWDDEDPAGDGALEHPSGSGSTAAGAAPTGDDGQVGTTGALGDDPDSDRGGKGEGRRR